jgi:hypothetical protein
LNAGHEQCSDVGNAGKSRELSAKKEPANNRRPDD